MKIKIKVKIYVGYPRKVVCRKDRKALFLSYVDSDRNSYFVITNG